MKRLALCIGSSLTLSLLLFCGSSKAAGYDEDVRHNFLGSCIKAALSNNADAAYASRYCHCLWDDVTKQVTYKDFDRLDKGKPLSAKAKASFDRIVAKCGGNPDLGTY